MRFKKSLILITGGYGFIGSNFIRYLFENTDFEGIVVNYDKLTYAANPLNLKDIEEKYKTRYIFEKGDISDKLRMEYVLKKYEPELIVNFAAETHVDRSIYYPEDFIKSNVYGTYVLLESSRKVLMNKKSFRFHHISTDEVYGSLEEDEFATENYPYYPSSPYSASKASSNHLVFSYYKTYGMDITISNSSNNYGPYQFPEKFIPVIILNLMNKERIPVYGKGLNQRTWIYVDDNNDAIWKIVNFSDSGEIYNVGSRDVLKNIDLVKMICKIWDSDFGGNNSFNLVEFVKDRPGHDLRYALNIDKITKNLKWEPKVKIKEGLKKTINWYVKNNDWINFVKSEEYRDWVKKNYSNR